MGGVALAATRHGDVRRRRTGGLAQCDMGAVDGVALRAVHGGRVGELDVLGDVFGWDAPLAAVPTEDQAAVVADLGHRPGLAVCDLDVGVVSSGGDPVADTQLLTAS